MCLAQRSVVCGLAGFHASAGQRPLAGMGAEAARAAAEHERRAAGHVGHATVDHIGRAGHAVVPVVGHVGGIGVVVARGAVDEQDRDRGVAASVQRVGVSVVGAQALGDAAAQRLVEGDHAAPIVTRASTPSNTSVNLVVSAEHPRRTMSGGRKSATTCDSEARRGTSQRASGCRIAT